MIEPASEEEKKLAVAADQERQEREEAKKAAEQAKKPAKEASKGKARKPKADPIPAPPLDQQAEASRKLKYAKQYLREAAGQTDEKEKDRLTGLARKHLKEIDEKFTDTPAAGEARKLLEDLK